jgi:hypothetical protein
MLQEQKKIDQIRTPWTQSHTYPQHNDPVALTMAITLIQNLNKSIEECNHKNKICTQSTISNLLILAITSHFSDEVVSLE